MKKSLFIFLVFYFSIIYSQIPKRVFFIGNSYTYTNNLPELIKQIATSTGDIMSYESHTPGGTTLQQHSINPNVIAKVNLGNWDYVVLQEQSQLPAFPTYQVETQSYPYAEQLVNLVNSENSCGKVIFFMTWGHKLGDQFNCPDFPYLCTYEGMDDRIYNSYMKMANDNESIVSPVGKVWRTLRMQNPSLELYSPDNSHPSYLGSMAAAYTFYTVIFKKDPTQIPYNGNLSVNDANIIKNVVKNTVFDHMDTWLITSNDVHSQFSSTYMNSQTVQFNNQTPNATSFLWDFGDGITSTLENPLHVYSNIGTYNVSLTTNACNSNTTRTKTININFLSTLETENKPFEIYPNPVRDEIHISSPEKISQIELFDPSGKLLPISILKNSMEYFVPVQHLSNGIYFLRINYKDKHFIHKIHKQ